MNERHWSEQDCIDSLYGTGPGDSHPDHCASCRDLLQAMQRVRGSLLREPEVSYGVLAEQRRAIYSRLESHSEPGPWLRLAPAFATVLTVLCAVLLSRTAPVTTTAPGLVSNADQHFYSDIYQEMNSDMPRAAAPIRKLFEE